MSNTPTMLKDGPTHEMLDRAIIELHRAIIRYENILDEFEGGGKSVEKSENQDKDRVNVVQTYRTAPAKINGATERLHQLIDRMQNQFS